MSELLFFQVYCCVTYIKYDPSIWSTAWWILVILYSHIITVTSWYRIIPPSLNIFCFLVLCALTASGSHCCTFWHCSSVFSRISCKCIYTVGGLWVWNWCQSMLLTVLLFFFFVEQYSKVWIDHNFPICLPADIYMFLVLDCMNVYTIFIKYVFSFLWDKYLAVRSWVMWQSLPLTSVIPLFNVAKSFCLLTTTVWAF